MRTVRDRNDPAEALPLPDIVIDPNSGGSLHNPRDAAERSGLRQDRQIGSETPLGSATIFRPIGTIHTVQVIVWRALGSSR